MKHDSRAIWIRATNVRVKLRELTTGRRRNAPSRREGSLLAIAGKGPWPRRAPSMSAPTRATAPMSPKMGAVLVSPPVFLARMATLPTVKAMRQIATDAAASKSRSQPGFLGSTNDGTPSRRLLGCALKVHADGRKITWAGVFEDSAVRDDPADHGNLHGRV
jgi:hypothetical protein